MTRTLAVCLLGLACGRLDASDWPRFRGPNGSGVAETTGLPADIGPAKNVLWKTALPRGLFLAGRERRPHLPHRLRGRDPAHARSRPGHGQGPLAPRGPSLPAGAPGSAQRTGLAQRGRRRQDRDRVLRRLRARLLRLRRARTLARPPGPFQQCLRDGRVPDPRGRRWWSSSATRAPTPSSPPSTRPRARCGGRPPGPMRSAATRRRPCSGLRTGPRRSSLRARFAWTRTPRRAARASGG